MREYGFGIDLGGTTVKLGLFKTTGELLEKWEIPTDKSEDGKNIIPDIVKAMDDKMKERGLTDNQIQGAGIGVPGAVTADGIVNRCVNVGWGIVPIEQQMTELCGFPVKAANDANIAALGEAWMGAGKDASSLVMITLGTGVGGGVVINRKIVTGFNGSAGEIGHIHVKDGEPDECGCGNHGCVEQYASATGVVKVAKRYLASDTRDSVLRKTEDFSCKDVFDAAKAGDDLADDIITDVCSTLGRLLAIITNIINPEEILIGGGVSKAGDIILEKARPVFLEQAFHAARDTKIKLATLGNDAGIYGGVGLIIDEN